MNVLLFLSGEKVTAYNTCVDKEKANDILKKCNGVFLENCNFPDYPSDDKQYNVYYRNGEIVYEEIPEPEPQETQLDRIESAVNDIAKNNTSYAEMAQAIAEGVNAIE